MAQAIAPANAPLRQAPQQSLVRQTVKTPRVKYVARRAPEVVPPVEPAESMPQVAPSLFPNLLLPLELPLPSDLPLMGLPTTAPDASLDAAVRSLEDYYVKYAGDWEGMAALCANLFFHTNATPELTEVLRHSGGAILPMPVKTRGQQLPILLRHSYERGTPNHKDFYYQLWHMDKPEKHGGPMMPTLCLNGPYRGEAFARLDEAMRCNNAWAWCTSEVRSRPTSLLLSATPKVLSCLADSGHWLSFKRFAELRPLPSDVFQLRDDGFTYRADVQPYSAFLPLGGVRSAEQQISVQWSRAHLSCVPAEAPCRCPAPCYHPTLDALSTKHELRLMLRNPADPYSKVQPHPRRLRRDPFWVRSECADHNYNWYDAVAYTVDRVY